MANQALQCSLKINPTLAKSEFKTTANVLSFSPTELGTQAHITSLVSVVTLPTHVMSITPK